jgi:SAM-dependent methyltransferase
LRLKKRRRKKDVENIMTHSTKRSGSFREWFRVRFLSGHLRKTRKDRDVLDLCCGWGFYFKINPNAWGVDIDGDCIAYLSRQGYKVKQSNVVETLPFSDGAFDLVITHDALEHFSLAEVKKIFENVRRVLKKDGKFMTVVPNRKGYEYGIKTDCGHKHFINPGEIQEIAGKQFIVIKSYSYPLARSIGRYFTHNKEVVILQKV